MKRSILIFLLLTSFISTAQQVVDSILVEIPISESRVGPHLINWKLGKEDISILGFGMQQAAQIVAKDSLAALEDKALKEQLLQLKKQGKFHQEFLPIVFEQKINTEGELAMKDISKLRFHNVDDLGEDQMVFCQNVYVQEASNQEPTLFYHYSELNRAFPNTVTLDSPIVSSIELKTMGSGVIGMKNVKSHLFAKNQLLKYDEEEGFVTKLVRNDLAVLNTEPQLEGYRKVADKRQYGQHEYIAWFANKTDNKYTFIQADSTGLTHAKEIRFEAPRKLKEANILVYDEQLNPKGYLTLFGYHKKGKKYRGLYPATKFDAIYIGLDGEIIFQTTFDLGSSRHFRHVLNPLMVIEQENQELRIANYWTHLPLSSGEYQLFDLSSRGYHHE